MMKRSNDPYGIGRMKEKEAQENERLERMQNAILDSVQELKKISEKLDKLDQKISEHD